MEFSTAQRDGVGPSVQKLEFGRGSLRDFYKKNVSTGSTMSHKKEAYPDEDWNHNKDGEEDVDSKSIESSFPKSWVHLPPHWGFGDGFPMLSFGCIIVWEWGCRTGEGSLGMSKCKSIVSIFLGSSVCLSIKDDHDRPPVIKGSGSVY